MSKLDDSNIDVILKEVEDFLHLYLFKGNVTLNDGSIKNLFELSDDNLITLKAVHFLFSKEVCDLVKILPQLVRNLAHSTQQETEIMHGNVRGRIDWGATLKERYSQGFDDKSLFVCNPPSKFYDLEENQLLKFLLNKIITCKRDYVNFISPTEFNLDKIEENKDWYQIVNDNVQMAKLTLKKVYFNDVSNVKIKSKHVRKCMKSRNLRYHQVVKAYRLYEDLFVLKNNKVLEDLVSKTIIRSTDTNKLYEIYVFFNLINSLPGPFEKKLLYSGNNYSTSCVDGDVEIKVHYQFTPPPLARNSQYDEILENYEINNHIRSPDVIIEFSKEGDTFYRIVEVKNTDKTGYVRDSVYKVMGYYQDFERIKFEEKHDFTKKYPIVLVTWSGIKLKKDHNPFDDEIIILNKKEFLDNLDELLSL